MSLLALDTATQVGWAFGPPGALPAFGSFKLPKTGEDIGQFLAAYEDKLLELIVRLRPTVVSFEAPLFLIYSSKKGKSNTNPNTARKLMGLTGETERICFRKGIERFEAHQQSHKKHFVGHNFSKATRPYPATVKCHEKGIMVTNHDEADAVAIWDYTCHKLWPEQARSLDPLAAYAGGW